MEKGLGNHKNKNKITRKEALKTMGKYAAMTEVGTFMILNPNRTHANSAVGGGVNPIS